MPTLSVIVITKNEARRIRRCLDSVRWAEEIVVVDSGSTDETLKICREFTEKVRVRPFDTFSAQKNAALNLATGDWILSLDADEVVSPELAWEIWETIRDPQRQYAGYLVARKNYLCGSPINHVWGHDRHVRLFRSGKGRFVHSVHEKVALEEPLGRLRHRLLHYNSDTLREYIAKNDVYTALEARVKYDSGERFSLVKLLLSPVRVFIFRFVMLGGYRDGVMGLVLSVLLAYFVFRIHWKMWELEGWGDQGFAEGLSVTEAATRSGDLPPVSILISSKDRRKLLDRVLASLAELDYPRDRMEIVVVEETDQPRPLPGIRYVPIPRENKGYGHTRNVAVAHARHDVLAFTDDDCVVDPIWLRELVTPLTQDKEVAGVAGAVLVEPGDLLGQCENILGFPGGGLKYIAASRGQAVPIRHLSTCNCAFRKEVVLKAGGFDVGTKYSGEDYLLAQRITARHRCLFNPRAIVFHNPRGSLRGIFWWFVRRGRSEVEMWDLVSDRRRHLLRGAYASLSLRGLALVAVLVWIGENVLLLLALLGGLYYLAMLWRYRYALRFSRPVAAYLLTPVVKAVMDAGMEWGRITGLKEFRRWRTAWR